MKYNIDWVKGLCDSDLILCNLLSFMRIYRYNLRYADISKNIIFDPAEANGITRIKIRLRTKDNKFYTPSPYYISNNEAELFKQKLITYFDARSG